MLKENKLLGCFGIKAEEYKQFWSDIILKNTDEDAIFVEPFCGSAIISKTLHDEGNLKHTYQWYWYIRKDFYKHVKDKVKRNKWHKMETKIKDIGKDEYLKYVSKGKTKNYYWKIWFLKGQKKNWPRLLLDKSYHKT